MTAPLGRANVGDVVVERSFPEVTRAFVARYARASGDTNRLHLDADFAREAGYDDVFAQGMLVMGLLARAVTDVVRPDSLRALSTRFVATTPLGAEIRVEGTIAELFEAEGERRARIALAAKDQTGAVKLAGEAIVAL